MVTVISNLQERKKKMSKGTCFIALNNKELDYISFSVHAANQIKKHFKKHNATALITDYDGRGYLESIYSIEEINSVFDEVVIDKTKYNDTDNTRIHFDTPWSEFVAPFKNRQKHDVYWMSPFDKTLLLDIDYIVQSNHLEYLFKDDNPHSIQMFDNARYLRYKQAPFSERYLHPNGIPMWWSTVIYFDKSPESKMFFDLWSHIADNYDYYKFLYGFTGKLFRTDFCVSIALHILNGMQHGDFVEPIAGSLINVDQKDFIAQSKTAENYHFLAYNRDEPWKNILVHIKDQDLHIMNKRSLMEAIEKYE